MHNKKTFVSSNLGNNVTCPIKMCVSCIFLFLFVYIFNMPALDIRGCLEDSPTFRKRIQSHEESIHNFEHSLKSLIKLSRLQVELTVGKLF